MARILCVDDDKNYLELAKQELEEGKYEVVTAENGTDAVERVREGNIDLVVMDIRMSGMDGLEAMAQIFYVKSDMPLILNSAYTSYKDNFMTWSADAYVVKSSDFTELKREISKALERRQKPLLGVK